MASEIATKLYTFNELSDEAKKNAIEEKRGFFDLYWWEPTVDSFVGHLSAMDFYTEARDVEFSDFYSKEGGASFTGRFDPSNKAINAFLSGENNYYSSLVKDSPWGSIKDLAGWMDDCLVKVFSEELLGHPDIEYIDDLVIDVKRLPSNYYHENTMQTYGRLSFGCEDDSSTIDLGEMERIEARVLNMLEESEGMFRKVALDLFGALRDEYEYLLKTPVEAQPVAWQYQDRKGNWHEFIDEGHRLNTIEDGSWPIRALYAHPPPSAPVGVGRKYPDDGNGVDDAYNRGWNDCLDALAPQPPAEAQAQGGGEMVAWPDGLLDRVKEVEE